MLNEYETNLILRGDLDDATSLGLIEKFEGQITAAGGTLLLRDDWGRRKLAYLVRKQPRGHFLILNWVGRPGLVTEFERRIRNEDNVVRFMTVRTGVDVDVAQRLSVAEEQRKLRAEQAKARAEAEQMAEAGGDEDEDYDT
jgi:small subunit ribosomal protein S6